MDGKSGEILRGDGTFDLNFHEFHLKKKNMYKKKRKIIVLKMHLSTIAC